MLIKAAFTKRLSSANALPPDAAARRAHSGERSLWQRRFREHRIRDDDDFARHVDYIHFNPVKHRLVTRAADWPHSSIHRHVRAGKVPADWGLAASPGGVFGE
jgi:putative transposase